MGPSPKLKSGDRARVTFESRTVDAVVFFASENGRSLFIVFEAILGGYVGEMPVLWKDGSFYDLVTNQVVSIERQTDG